MNYMHTSIMIYVIITTCLTSTSWCDAPTREEQYKRGIQSILQRCKGTPNIRVIAVEGNGPRKTFLDELGLDAVFYTHSNKFPTGNYGTKEFLDIMQCIFHFNMQDHDFVVKMTGRYYLDEKCPFMDSIQMLSNPDYQYVLDVVFRYGTSTPSEMHDYKQDMCHTSLIGMRVYYLRNIGQLDAPPCSPVEKYWVLVIRQIPQDKQRILKQLGIHINLAWSCSPNYYLT